MEQAILIVDFGTSNVRAVCFSSETGMVLASQSRKYTLISPVPSYQELDPREVWELSVDCVRTVMEKIGKSAVVRALNFSFIGASLFPLDDMFEPTYNCILCFDPRAVDIASEMAPKFRTTTTHFNDHWAPPAKILWLKEHEPAVFAKTKYYWSIQQYILYRLGLTPMWDPTMANLQDMFDLADNDWREDILTYAGITRDQIDAPLIASDQTVGMTDHYGDVELGTKIPVGVGAHDGDLGMLGLGLLGEDGDVIAEVSGTFDHLGFIADKDERTHKIKWKPGLLKDTMVIMLGFPTYGADIEWFIRTFYNGNSEEAYADLWANCSFDGMPSLLVNPAFSGCGTFFNMDLTTTKYDIFKGLVEALTFETRRSAEAALRHKKNGAVRIRIGGGPSSSDEWAQLRANITGMTIERVVSSDNSALGAAVLASLFAGLYPSVADASAHLVRVRDSFVPDPKLFALYNERYREYCEKIPRSEE